ncbi:MAG TPA: phenylalanine--tRNA ligase subunit alpha, partial [Armatimonadota bacterium]|nr:phenylalanine--tRNA ligase subunit alpha [Armatimonadota bacterium]
MDIINQLTQIEQDALVKVQEAMTRDALEAVRVEYLGRKGLLTGVLRGMGQLSPEERPVVGQRANEVRQRLEAAFDDRRVQVEAAEEGRKLEAERIDVTLPGRAPRVGRKHPLTRVLDEVKSIFTGMGFEVLDGPEVETFQFNFASLNYPEDHPAMDDQDSFYLTDDVLLRTHTTATQTRILSERKPPVRCIYPGRVHRREQVTLRHSHTFHQVDGLLVDEGVTFADLKGTLAVFFKEMFGKTTEMRFRADYFPFTEPSAEFAITCFECHGKGCRLCSNTGWIELGGSGMVHPNILRGVGLDPQRYTGWAFGFGVDRVAMRQYGVGDIRLWVENDMR